MFYEIDYPAWDRREIYECFYGYTYSLTAELDVSRFLETVHKNGWKFYPSICYCIAKTVNENQCFRYAKVNGKVGYWDQVQAHYTLMRRDTDHLFTHQRTLYSPDFAEFYDRFLQDKEKGELCSRLYNDLSGAMDNVHISTMPGVVISGLAYSKPVSFTHYDTPNTSFVPFVMVGKYREKEGGMWMPVTTEFHHAVNDGYHAELFYQRLQECLDQFKG